MSSSSQAAEAAVGEYVWLDALYWKRFAPKCWRARFLGKPWSCAGSRSAALAATTVAAEIIERRNVFFMCIWVIGRLAALREEQTFRQTCKCFYKKYHIS